MCTLHMVYTCISCTCILGKVTALGVLCCFALFVCLTLLASFFLPSHLSFKNMYIMYMYMVYRLIRAYSKHVLRSGQASISR